MWNYVLRIEGKDGKDHLYKLEGDKAIARAKYQKALEVVKGRKVSLEEHVLGDIYVLRRNY